MKLNIPFYTAPNGYCGQACLKMVLSYFFNTTKVQSLSLNKLAKLSLRNDDGSTWSIGLVKVLGEYELKVEFYTEKLYPNLQKIKYNYLENFSKLLKKVEKMKNVKIYEGYVKPEIIERSLKLNSIPIALIDWNKLKGKNNYQGHFVVISGYSKSSFYIHNPGPEDAKSFLRVEKRKFLRCWKTVETDSDLIITSRT